MFDFLRINIIFYQHIFAQCRYILAALPSSILYLPVVVVVSQSVDATLECGHKERLETLQTFDQSDVLTKKQIDKKTNRQIDKKTTKR